MAHNLHHYSARAFEEIHQHPQLSERVAPAGTVSEGPHPLKGAVLPLLGAQCVSEALRWQRGRELDIPENNPTSPFSNSSVTLVDVIN